MKRCVDIAELAAPTVIGQMYSAVGKTRSQTAYERARQALLALETRSSSPTMRRNAEYVWIEPLHRFETDFLDTVEQAMTFLALVGREAVGLLLDAFQYEHRGDKHPGCAAPRRQESISFPCPRERSRDALS